VLSWSGLQRIVINGDGEWIDFPDILPRRTLKILKLWRPSFTFASFWNAFKFSAPFDVKEVVGEIVY